jgi:hypothetical protein
VLQCESNYDYDWVYKNIFEDKVATDFLVTFFIQSGKNVNFVNNDIRNCHRGGIFINTDTTFRDYGSRFYNNSGNTGGIGVLLKGPMYYYGSEFYHNVGYDCGCLQID